MIKSFAITRKQEGISLLGYDFKYVIDLLFEIHIEQLIGLVEN